MILMQKFRRFLLTISLSILLITVTAFGFGTMDSQAANLPTQLATKNQAEIMTKDNESNSKMVQEEEANRFKSESLEGMNKSIVNPNYQPGGKTKQSAREDRQDLKDIKTEASDSMDSYVDE
jgi:cbb3-type cytochrome oxidase subunit 3